MSPRRKLHNFEIGPRKNPHTCGAYSVNDGYITIESIELYNEFYDDWYLVDVDADQNISLRQICEDQARRDYIQMMADGELPQQPLAIGGVA